MKGFLVALAALLLLPAFLPPASADVTHSTTFTGGAIPYDGNATIPIEISVECPVIVMNGGGSATIQTAGLPAWLNATSTTVTFDPSECAGGPTGNLVKQAELILTPSSTAPGLVNASLNATIVYTGEIPVSEVQPAPAPVELPDVFVAYRPGHVMTPDGDQTFTVTDGTYAFDMTVDITANARTMIMFEDKKVTGGGLLTGLQAKVFDVPNGETRLVQPVKFTAPQGEWDTVRVSFYNYSHCLDGTDCGPQVEKTITWTFKNGNTTAVEPAGEKTDSKGAPGPAIPAILAALALVAVIARRKA
ncbi:MAG TPA: hypothetical protein VJ874_01315 [Candidatus Thermoplasmatota archaeon]|nr:hypothetical protein [Candidatus Thermoplasmatota archaeon]